MLKQPFSKVHNFRRNSAFRTLCSWYSSFVNYARGGLAPLRPYCLKRTGTKKPKLTSFRALGKCPCTALGPALSEFLLKGALNGILVFTVFHCFNYQYKLIVASYYPIDTYWILKCARKKSNNCNSINPTSIVRFVQGDLCKQWGSE